MMLVVRSGLKSKFQAGFALPTILIVSTVLLVILVAGIGSATSSRVALDNQYYELLASQAGESGLSRVKECLSYSGYKPQWSTIAASKDLRPNTNCSGGVVIGLSPFVMGVFSGDPATNSRVRTTYSVEAPAGSKIGSILKIVGRTELVRASSPFSVWRKYEKAIYYRIEAPLAIACPDGFISVPGSVKYSTTSFCVSKYETKNVGGKVVSQASGTPWVNINQTAAVAAASGACNGCHLITDAEWLTIAQNIASVGSNWSGGEVGSGNLFRGHSDNNPGSALQASIDDNDSYFATNNMSGDQRRTFSLSNGKVIWDFAGNVDEWTAGTTTGGQPGLAGWSWREWNAGGLTPGSISPNPFPAFFGLLGSSTWDSSKGVGRLYSNTSDTTLKGIIRGGYWNSGANSGVSTLSFVDPAISSYQIGFRVVYDPNKVVKAPDPADTAFLFNTAAAGCGGTVQLPVSSPTTGGTVNWGDGTVEPVSASLQSHTYAASGEYLVVYAGPISEVDYYSSVDATNAKCLTKVTQWSNTISPTKVNFGKANNLIYVSKPPTSVIDLSNMFRDAFVFNQDISDWDVSNVKYMSGMFREALAFNQPIGSWDTSKVENMNTMFYTNESSTSAFNQSIKNWDTSQVTDMGYMFRGATVFDQDIGTWDTSKVTNMRGMFRRALVFNQNISNWDTSKVTDMGLMFSRARLFNQPIKTNGVKWNTSNVTKMDYMFSNAKDFNQDISNWDTAKVTTMQGTFFCDDDIPVSCPLSFNGNINSWNTSNVIDMTEMFHNALANSSFNSDIGSWDTSKVKYMSEMFRGAAAFNQDISNWNTSSVTNMSYMFARAISFNQPIRTNGVRWNTSNVEDMSYMFSNAKAFNRDISNWNTAKVTDMQWMFFCGESSSDCPLAFNQNIGGWNTGQVRNMSRMFYNKAGNSVFNRSINSWNTAQVEDMNGMFRGAAAFNQNISGWDTSKVTNMNEMFNSATNFNRNLSSWNVTNVSPKPPIDFRVGATSWTLPRPGTGW